MSEFKVEKLNDGYGEVCHKGATVTVHYTGKLQNGQKFDSSVDRGQPFKFVVGVGQVIKGWDEGIVQLKRGQKAVITCPPSYAYGANGIPGVIPPNSTLIFDVEMIEFI